MGGLKNKTVYLPHEIDAEKLNGVVAAMRNLGAPTIRVVDCGDYYQAIEGTHRLAAAEQLGITPELDVIAADAIVDHHDIYDLPKMTTAAEIVEYLSGPPRVSIQFWG